MVVYLFRAKNTGHYAIYFGAKTNWHLTFLEFYYSTFCTYGLIFSYSLYSLIYPTIFLVTLNKDRKSYG